MDELHERRPRWIIRRQPNCVRHQRYAWKLNPWRYPVSDLRGWHPDGFALTFVGALLRVTVGEAWRRTYVRGREKLYPAREWSL